ncbi:MAG: nuclease-related domain-containing protein [Candidatus Izemoplasmatales bacterium]
MWWILIVLIIIMLGLTFIKSPKGKGMIGEFRVNRIIKKAALDLGGIELHDLMYQDEISSSQIDHLLLTQKALYVIETKNYNGYIYGNESSHDWTMTVKHINQYKNRKGKKYLKVNISKHQFYNPIKQNQTHIRKIMNLTDININIINIVVFGRKAILKDVKHSDQVYVVHEHELLKTIQRIENNISNKKTIEVQIDVLDQLIYHNIKDRKSRRGHVQRIKAKYKKN